MGGAAEEPDVFALLSEASAYWDFEGEGPTLLAKYGSGELTLNGATLSAGPTGQQLTLGGTETSALSDRPPLDTSGDLTVMAWVKLDALDGFDTFVAVDGDSVSPLYLQKRSDDRLSFTTLPSDSTSASSCVATAEIRPRVGEWYFVVGTRDSTTREQRIYVDGALSGKVVCPGGVFSASGGASMGRGLYGGEAVDFLSGAVDDVGFLARVVSPGEIFELYQHGRPAAPHYLFVYFVEVAEGRGDGLRLAHSHDGLHWGALGAGKVFMPPSVGGGSFRDPHVMQDPEGVYHLVWTTTCVPWAEANCVQDRGLGHASSADLVTWTPADYVAIDLDVEHVWAPETYFDASSGQYMIFWSSPPDQDPGQSDPHDIYYVLTSDFQSFSEPEVLYAQAGRNFIDATITAAGAGFLMVLKDEADGQKNLRALRSPALYGPDAWLDAPSESLTGDYAAEGPSFLRRDGELYVYFDKYGEGAYGALRALGDSDLSLPSSWQDVSGSVFFPGVRHGTPIEVPSDVYRAVAVHAGL